MELKYLEDHVEGYPLVKKQPLWYHKRGLMQTATGYGNKLRTEWMVLLDGRWRRVYCRIFSNSGTLYIIWKKEEYIIRDEFSMFGGG